MAQRWRDERREFGGNQRPAYWDQSEQNQRGEQRASDQRASDQRGWQGEGGGWQGRGDEEYERWGRGQESRGQSSGPGGEQGYYGREGEDVRHGGQQGREWGANYGSGSQSASGWRGGQSAFYGEEGGNIGRDAPYSHGGQGHRQRRGMGGSGQSGYGQSGYQAGGYGGAGGYGYERDWPGSQEMGGGRGRYEQRGYEQRGSRWAPFGGADEETWGPRSQRGMGAWRDQYGSGEAYGRGGGPAGQMDTGPGAYGQGDYGRDMRGSHMQGPHRGKGPKGYERSAERLKEDICERLSDAHDVDASEISISVKDGVVTLEGSVESRQMKHRAEDIVESCSGVKDVENRLKVQSQQGQQQSGQQAGQSAGQSGVSNQNRLTTGGPLHH